MTTSLGGRTPILAFEDDDDPGVVISSRYSDRVAHIEVIGTLFNGSTELASVGSGLLLGNVVLTNNHVIPPEGRYQSLEINVRLGLRSDSPIAAQATHRDQVRDLALLKLSLPLSDVAGQCPVQAITVPEQARPGAAIFVIGYPLNQEKSITAGIISNHLGRAGTWQTDSTMNPGNSGGPVFSRRGHLVGIAVGGIVKHRMPTGEEITIQGVNFLIPATVLLQSALIDVIDSMPESSRCFDRLLRQRMVVTPVSEVIKHENPFLKYSPFKELFSSKKKYVAPTVIESDSPSKLSKTVVLPSLLRKSLRINSSTIVPSLTTANQVVYERKYAADKHYRIVGCTMSAIAESKVEAVECKVTEKGATVLARIVLPRLGMTGGPDGYFHGDILIEQALVQ